MKIIDFDFKLHLSQIVKLEKELFYLNGYNEEEIKKLLQNSCFKIKIVENNCFVCGYVLYFETYDFIEIYKIGIDKYFQKMKYGSSLLDEIKKINKKIFIEVSDNDNTFMFYLKNGFKKTGERKNYYIDNSNAILMQFKN